MVLKGYGPKATVPLELRLQPRDYQLQGLYWLTRPNPSGKILADDMGLGKTLEALATVAALPKRSNASPRTLIIVPRQVLHNWMNETDKVFNPTTHPHAMAVTIGHGYEGLKTLANSVQALKSERMYQSSQAWRNSMQRSSP